MQLGEGLGARKGCKKRSKAIAAGVFRRRTVSSQEDMLPSRIHSYIQKLALSKTKAQPILGIANEAYREYLSWMIDKGRKRDKKEKSGFITSGRLWVISKLSLTYVSSGDIPLPRHQHEEH
ncbi:hypothetical protein ACFLVS_02660 [Chloroflexota bacterium]